MDWESVDWAILERLRAHFLGRTSDAEPYWLSRSDLEHYDFTFGRRIAWKWAAVLEPLLRSGWMPPARRLVDWGCGSGIAARSLLAHAPAGSFDEIVLWDRSPAATSFAADRIHERSPAMTVRVTDPQSLAEDDPAFVLTVSHVINELDAPARDTLLDIARRATAVLWVESGTAGDSRALVEAREKLRSEFHCIAPCPHNEVCGMLAPGNERHWCHHFARSPTEVFTEGGWARFGQLLGIDLRSLPYSYLVLDRRPRASPQRESRLIGRPRESAGLMRIQRCRVEGVHEVELQKRDVPALWKTLQKGKHDGAFSWTERAGRIVDQRS